MLEAELGCEGVDLDINRGGGWMVTAKCFP